MNIADLIAALQRGEDPNQAIPAQYTPGIAGDNPGRTAAANPGIRPEYTQSGFMPPMPPAPPAMAQAPAPAAPPPSAPQGVATPLTNPQPPGQAPTIMQSPPDLSNMYLQLIQKNQNAQAMDSSLALIAAGFSNNLGTRQALIQHASAAGRGGAGQHVSAADLIGLQKQAQANKDMMLRRSMLAGLAKQYNLTPEAAFILESSGKFDELIKEQEGKGLTVVEDNATGQKSFYDFRGRKITDVGGPKPRETETRDTFRGPITVYKDTGLPVTGEPIGGEKPVEGTPVRTEGGQTVFVNPRDATQIGAPIGEPKKPTTQLGTGPQGSQVINMETGLPVAPGIGQPVPDEMRVLAMKIDEANRERVAAGKPPLTFEQGARIFGKTGVSVNVGDQGQKFPAPPPGQDYRRTAEGAVAVDAATGEPTLYDLPGGEAKILREKHQADLVKTTAEGKALERKDVKAAEGDLEKARAKYSAISSVFAASENAERIMGNAPWYAPATGFMSSQFTAAGGTPATNLRAQLKTIESNTAFAQLQSMRDASPTGAALGPVSDFENKMLSSTIASIDPNQSDEFVLQGIRRIKANMVVLAERNFREEARKAGAGDPKTPQNEAKALELYTDAINKEMAKFEKQAGPKATRGGSVERIN